MINQKELQMGTAIEHEHTQDDRLAQKIAMDHLREDPHYYTKLNAAGLEQEGAMTNQERGMEETAKLSSSGLDGAGIPKQLKSDELDECGVDIAIVKVGPQNSGEASPSKPLTSSNLGSGVPKPLTSDALQAPKGKNSIGQLGKTPVKMGGKDSAMGDLNVKGAKIQDEEGNEKPNNIEYGKTPSIGGMSNSNFDATDFFGGQISKVLRIEEPRTMEMIPTNVSESSKWNISLKKKITR